MLDLLAPACLLAGAVLAGLAALWRLDDLGEGVVAASGVGALVLLLAGERLVARAPAVGGFGAVVAGLVAVCVLSGAAVRLLAADGSGRGWRLEVSGGARVAEDSGAALPSGPSRRPERPPDAPRPPGVRSRPPTLLAPDEGSALALPPGLRSGPRADIAAASALAGAGVGAAALAGSLEVAYVGAAVAVLGGWLAAALDRGTGRAALRAVGRYALFCLAGDLGVLAAPLLAGRAPAVAAGGLVLAAAVRLRLFPFHGASELSRLGGRAYLASVVFGGMVGVSLLARASGAPSAGLYAAALLTALAALLALPLPRPYRLTIDLIGLVDAAHVAAAFALATPLALAAGLLHALGSASARAILLLVADTTSPRGQQRARLRGPLALLPFTFGFATLTGMPPSPGFVARWVLYLALLEAGAWPLVLVLAFASGASLLELLRRIGGFGAPDPAWRHGRALAIGLVLLWLPMGLIAITPIALIEGPIEATVAALRTGEAFGLGVDTLLGLAGVLALLLCIAIVLLGFALYAERELGPLRRVLLGWRRISRGAGWRGLRVAALAGTPWRWLGMFGEMVAGALGAALAPWEARFVAVGMVALGFAVVLVALG